MLDVLEIGGGHNPRYHPNVDVVYGDVQVDVRLGLPFASESVKCIYSSDFVEHLTFIELLRLLQECWRILIPNGVLDFTVPDMARAVAVNPSWNDALSHVVYGTRRDAFDVHRAWYSPALLGYVLEHEGWAVTHYETEHGMPLEPKFRVEARKA